MDPVAMSAEELVEAATISGAKALQLDKRIGSIEIGKYADIITIDINNIHAIPIYNPYSQIVYTLSPADVSYVVINGKIVMAKGKILTLNEDEIKETMLEIQNTIIHDLQ